MTTKPSCPRCGDPLEPGYLYVRGLGASVHWSTEPGKSFLSRKGLRQLDLSAGSQTNAGGQAELESHHCPSCNLYCFSLSDDG